jgi:Helix-turn-helix domain
MLINIMGDSMTQCNSDASATQEERLLNHLLKGHALTPMQALEQFGVFRLAARIHALRQAIQIDRKLIVTPSGRRIAQYSIAQRKRPQ